MLRLSHVTAGYDRKQSSTANALAAPVLNDLSFEIPTGGLAVILGGSASGKSSVLRLLTGELRPESGEIQANGISIAGLRGEALARHRRSIGVLSAEHGLLADRSIEANIRLRLEIDGLSGERQAGRLRETLERFGLTGVRSALPSAVSMSERQRAALARAVVTEPFLLLADEPAAHLDAAGAGEIATLLEQEHLRGMTVLITTHDPAYADRFRDAQRITL